MFSHSFNIERRQEWKQEKKGLRQQKQRVLAVISVVSIDHFGDFCLPFQ